jgi:hypothetical protein
MITISDPRQVWQEFSSDFRKAEPIVPTSLELDSVVDTIIDDITKGRDIQAFDKPQVVAKFLASASGGRGANKHFLSFLDDLQHQTSEEKVTKVRLIRAINLLYNYDYFAGDEGWSQPFFEHDEIARATECLSFRPLDSRSGMDIE